MNSPEILDTVSARGLLPVSKPPKVKKSLLPYYFKQGLLLVAIYALIINQAQRNKKKASQPEIKTDNNKVSNDKPSDLPANLNYQNTSFRLQK